MKGVKKLFEDPFIEVLEVSYINRFGEERRWDYVARKNGIRAVVVYPLVSEKEILLIRQFRMPVGCYVIEFPAGLMDQPGEKPEACALRELKEETGYGGKVLSVSPLLVTSAGLTSESIYMVKVEVDETPGEQELEGSEEIEVFRVPLEGIGKRLQEWSRKGCLIDSKVWCLLAYQG